MKRSGPLRRTKWMKPRSKKRIEQDKEYHDVVAEIVAERGTQCEFTDAAGIRCQNRYRDPHHRLSQGRSHRHADRIDKRNILLVCRAHHDWIETHRLEALELGYLKKARPDGG